MIETINIYDSRAFAIEQRPWLLRSGDQPEEVGEFVASSSPRVYQHNRSLRTVLMRWENSSADHKERARRALSCIRLSPSATMCGRM